MTFQSKGQRKSTTLSEQRTISPAQAKKEKKNTNGMASNNADKSAIDGQSDI